MSDEALPPLSDDEVASMIAGQESSYVAALYDPSRWYSRARALFGASRALADRARTLLIEPEVHELGRVYRMLAGMALEALFKALLVARIKEDERSAEFPDHLKTHDLRVLGERLKLGFTDEEEMCIRNLTDHIVWVGRYPVPLHPEQFGSFAHWKEEEIVEGLFRRLSKPLDLAS